MSLTSGYFLLVCFLVQGELHAQEAVADVVWIGPPVNQSGNWSVPGNWNTGTVPGPGDQVFITAGGSFTVTLDVDAEIAGLAIGNPQEGTVSQTLLLSAGQTLTVSTSFDWHGGTIRGPGTLANKGTMNITSGFIQTLNDAALLDNTGIVNIATTELRGGGGAVLNNMPGGEVVLLAGADANTTFQNEPFLNLINQGMVRKPVGGGVASWRLPYNSQGGTIEVQEGTLILGLGGRSSGGTIIVAPNATLDFSSGTFDHIFEGPFGGLVDGNVILDTAIDPKGVNFAFEHFNWFGGTLTGPGTLKNDGVFNLNAGSIQTMNAAAAIENNGIINISTNEFRGGGGATIKNLPGGTVVLLDNADANTTFQVEPILNLINQGLVLKPQGQGIAAWRLTYSNEGGTIEVQDGTLILGRGGRSTGGTIMVAPDATLDFRGGDFAHNFAGTYTGSADGSVILDTNIDAAGAIFNFQNLNWTGGFLRGPGTVTNQGTISITGGSAREMNDAASLENSGTINFGTEEFRGGGGAKIINLAGGNFILQDNADANTTFQAEPILSLINQGNVSKPLGLGAATWRLTYSNQGGTIDVQQGTLILGRGGKSTGGNIVVAPGASLDFSSGSFDHEFGGIFNGLAEGNVTLDTKIVPTGATFDFESFNWFGGALRGPGTLVNQGALSMTPGSIQTMNDTASIENTGTINFGSDEFRGGGGATINNLPGGSFLLQDNADANTTFQVEPILNLINQGLVSKPVGQGIAAWRLTYSNQGGTIDVGEGTLIFGRGGASSGGTIDVAPNATLDFNSGTFDHVFSGIYSGTASGNIILDTTVDSAGANFIFEDFNWFGGTLRGPGTLRNDGLLRITAGSIQTMNQSAVIDNAGTINFSTSEFRGGGSAILNNLATGSFFVLDAADANTTFQTEPFLNLINQGQFTKLEGPGSAFWGVDFTNEGGTVEALGGDLRFTRGYVQTEGTTSLSGGNFVVSGGDMDIQGGIVTGSGFIIGKMINNGEVFPGGSPGRLSISGSYTQLPSGSLAIEIAGPVAGTELDQLAVTGTADLSGTMTVNLIDAFVPTEGQQLVVMTFGSLAGSFDQFDGLDLGGGLSLTPIFTERTLILEAAGANLTASPPALDFGEVPVESLVVQQLTVTNNGSASITVNSVEITGANPEVFFVDPTPFTLDPGASQPLTVEFAPMLAGFFSAELVVISDALTIIVPLSGSGVQDANQRAALEDLFNSTDGPNWTNNTNWLSDQSVGTWFGVEADQDDDVLALQLPENNLVGTIPASIGTLSELRTLDLSRNQLSGPLPAQIDSLFDLTELVLRENQLSGNIPAEIGNLSFLERLDLAQNQLTGTIPAEIGNLSTLTELSLGTNQISGAIPPGIGTLFNLAFLGLNNNQLDGAIPTEIGDLTNLSTLQLEANQLQGAIPAEIGNLVNLSDLRLDVNKLSGTIPVEIGNLHNLQTLELAENQLTGTVPLEMRNLANLAILFLNDNRLVDLPDLSVLQSLGELHIQSNRFTFEDIEPNLGVQTFTYAPQDSVGMAEQESVLLGTSLALSVNVGGESNLYQWVKDGIDVIGANTAELLLDPVRLSDAGVYGCRVTNAQATDLTVRRRPITVIVNAPEPVLVDVPSPPTAGSDQTLNITSPAAFQPTNSQMFYRRAGESDYQMTPLSQSGNEFQGTIPADFITIRGTEYYVSLSDGQLEITFPGVDPANNPAILPVQIDQMSYPLALQPETYKMISLPLTLSSSLIEVVLGDDYGEYEILPRRWRIFRLQNGVYLEHPNIPQSFENGLAFWLITREGLPFDIENGQSVNSADSVEITLEPGFNQIGNPFAFAIDWIDVTASGNVQAPIPFDGVQYLLPVATLSPFEGYFVFNAELTPVTLTFPPTESPGVATQSLSKFQQRRPGDYVLRLMATVPGTTLRDTENYLGFRADATDLLDELDVIAPPPIGNHVELSITDAGYPLATNFKALHDFGQEWLLEISTTATLKPVMVSLQELGDPPAGFEIFLFDLDLQRIVPVHERSFTLLPDRNLEVRRLSVVIGTESFVTQNSDGIPLVPVEFSLGQNFPNPFNPETTIEYQLSKTAAVRLEVFNLLGQKVRTLVQGERPAGVHFVKWNGLDDLGRNVANGVYVYKLTAGSQTATRKLVIMQ